MTFRTAPQRDPLAPRRAALYLRVSTGRQAAGDVSIPSQRDLTRRFCEAQGWVVTAEFIEPGASATDDRRPAFQRMLDEATSPNRRFDIICVHAFSRFYRNGAEMELTIRKLRKHGVEVVSVTQPTGDDPSQEMMRQMIGIFDEYTSRENGKNVIRAMRESAKQGFWNGTTPPLGYRIVAAERRGSKVKKRLEIDPVEAELPVAASEGQGVVLPHRPAVDDPLVHAPEMGMAEAEAQGVDHARHQGKLFGRADRAAHADGIVRSGPPPGLDVLQRFRTVEFLHRVVEAHAEARPGKLLQVVCVEPSRVGQEFGGEGGVIPPSFGEFADGTRHVAVWKLFC